MRNDIEEYLYIEWLEAREYVTAKKRQKQGNTIREYIRTDSQWLSKTPSYRDFLFGKAAKQQEEKKEVKEVLDDSDRIANESNGRLQRE